MKEKIVQILTEQYRKSGIHNGMRTSDICEKLGCDFREVKNVLNQLFLEGVIEIKNSVNHKFIRLKDVQSDNTESTQKG